mmetsp:Transcript_27432/g.36695  ORF Transcript_27432/g.36695 Transcript_27432/m.36695 type:complete len:177 (+) Transcript_27432:477-1007(+)
MNFWLCYFHWRSGILCTLLSIAPVYISRFLFYNDVVALNFLVSLPWHSLNLFFIHLIISKVGMLFVETEVLRSGNEKILDGLEEGVVIVEEDSHDILYYNAAASSRKRSKKGTDKEFKTNEKLAMKDMLKAKERKRFAKIDKSIFLGAVVDTNATLKKLNEANNLMSMQEIILSAV